MDVVIVESPAKAKTINKYLGSGYKVMASYGHVRDLPAKDGSVRPDEDFSMDWEVDSAAKKRLSEIAAAVKGADHLYLATDPDREGEAISWHVLEVLKRRRGALNGVDVKRVVFNEITKSAILKAMEAPRDLDQQLVDAYLARRALDYLVGFTLSPVLWRKLPGARSAGRVQSVALRLVVDREMEIEAFKPVEYWSIDVAAKTPEDEDFSARLTVLDGKKLTKHGLNDETSAMAAKAAIEAESFKVATVEAKPTKRHPYPPFTTSTLQQEAARKLGFSASRTMQVAQKLYEGVSLGGETTGLITYMRTDGVQMAGEAIAAARDVIADQFGDSYLPKVPRAYKTKAKNAQEAHEAIRPTRLSRTPEAVAGVLNDDQKRLYDLIWKRAIASQMESAAVERTTVDLNSSNGRIVLRANGSVITFPGFLKLYQESIDDPKKDDDDKSLPAMREGDTPQIEKVAANQHFTEPPPRFSEASLVKKLEELGIGRPSTYASILTVLRERNYVRTEKNRFIPEDKGRLVTAFLETFFERYVEYGFTAALEEQLDEVSDGKADWKKVLEEFWSQFKPKTDEALGLRMAEVIGALNDYLGSYLFKAREDGSDPRKCPTCGDGELSLKPGKYGAFIGCSNYPECRYTRPFS
ncbi:MAG: type I DNA topoisomerase, partial [Sphingomonadales bacterium]